MKSMKLQLLLPMACVFVYGSFSLAQTPPGKSLALKDAIDMALNNNPSLQQSVEKINQANTEVPYARSALYPNLSATAQSEQNKDATNSRFASASSTGKFSSAAYNQYDAELKLTQTLFQVGSISAIHAADKDVHISKLNADISRRDLINNVIQAYYQVVLNGRNVETLLAQEKIAQESVDVSSRREKSGRGQLLDELQSKTQLELLEGQLSTAKNALEVSAANLANLLGAQSTGQHYQIPDALGAPVMETIDQSMKSKDAHIPEIEIAKISIDQIEDRRDVLTGQNMPTFGAFGTYGFNSYRPNDLFKDEANSWNIGLQLTIPIFSGFSYHAQDQALLSQRSQLEYNKTATENLISYQQTTSRKNLESALDSIRTGDEGLKLATASSKEARRNFKLATIDFLQYLLVQQAQVQAEQSLNAYKFNYIAALGNYYAAYGQDMTQLVDLLQQAK